MELISLRCLFLLLPGVFMFQQNRYSITFEKLEVVQYNTSYIEFLKTDNFKLNESNAAVNISINVKKTLTDELKLKVVSHQFRRNVYIPFPVEFKFNFCESINRDDFGLHRLLECGNFTGCPFKEGTYHICNWIPNSNKFPPNVPAGNYRNDLKIYYGSAEVMFLQGYGSTTFTEG